MMASFNPDTNPPFRTKGDLAVFPAFRTPLFTHTTDVDRMRNYLDEFWFIVERGNVLTVSWYTDVRLSNVWTEDKHREAYNAYWKGERV